MSERINRKDIKEVKLCHRSDADGKMIHLVTMNDGSVIEKFTPEMRKLGLLKVRGGGLPT